MSPPVHLCSPECCLRDFSGPATRIVVTGGPGAGKTAVLEMARRQFCRGVEVLPEAASILFRGGFPRREDAIGRRSVQRAIFHVTSELERMELEEGDTRVLLCDRGTLDGLAYWPGRVEDFFTQLATTKAEQLARYDAVVHLRVPEAENGYDRSNPMRIETADEALAIDQRILEIWADHPNRHVVDASDAFVDKVDRAILVLSGLIPAACRPRRSSSPPDQG